MSFQGSFRVVYKYAGYYMYTWLYLARIGPPVDWIRNPPIWGPPGGLVRELHRIVLWMSLQGSFRVVYMYARYYMHTWLYLA